MNVSPKLINLTEQISKNNTNSNHHLSRSNTKIDEQFGSKVLAEDVYHKSEHIPQDKSTYESVMTISTKRSKVSASGAFINAYKTIYFAGVPDQLGQLKPEFDKEIPTTMIEGLKHDRSFNGKSKYLGKYEVSSENFADIIDIKQLIASTEGNNSRFFDSQVDYFQYQRELESQLAEKAEVKYSW